MKAAKGLPEWCCVGRCGCDFCEELCGVRWLNVGCFFMLLLLSFLFWGVVRCRLRGGWLLIVVGSRCWFRHRRESCRKGVV